MNLSGVDSGVFDRDLLLWLFLAMELFEKLMKAVNPFPGDNEHANRHTQLCILFGDFLAS